MHNFSYLGAQKYQCQDCGLECDKSSVAEILATECPGATLPAQITAAVAENADKITELEERMSDIEKSLIEGVETK